MEYDGSQSARRINCLEHMGTERTCWPGRKLENPPPSPRTQAAPKSRNLLCCIERTAPANRALPSRANQDQKHLPFQTRHLTKVVASALVIRDPRHRPQLQQRWDAWKASRTAGQKPKAARMREGFRLGVSFALVQDQLSQHHSANKETQALQKQHNRCSEQ